MDRKGIKLLILVLLAIATIVFASARLVPASAQEHPMRNALAMASRVAAIPPANLIDPCPRFKPGSLLTQPPDMFSQNGTLNVSLNYKTIVDESDGFSASNGLQLFCFSTPDGEESPTLHVWPGDHLIIKVRNDAPSSLVLESDGTIDENQPPGTDNIFEQGMTISSPCQDGTMYASSVNIHFHGLNVAPVCGQDDVLHTVINSGHTFTYDLNIPANEPPGLYWYHPHIHGINEGIVQGGATAALVVEGIQNVQHEVAGLPEQTLIVRDQPVPGNPNPVQGSEVPSWDLTLNYVTISSCQQVQPCAENQFVGDFKPAVMQMKPGEKQLWRVLNSAAHTAIDLQLVYDGNPQPLTVVGLDGTPVNSQDANRRGSTFSVTDISLPPASRAEFIVTGPSGSVKNAVFKTLRVVTGPDGDNHPTRPLAKIETSHNAPEPPLAIGGVNGAPTPQRFEGLATAFPNKYRKLYFSETLSDPTNPLSPTNFFITVDGQTPAVFNPDNPPAITTTQGSVEDWTIENQAQENHAFHIHQIHFLVLARNGVPVPPEQQQYLDTVNLPFWTGTGPYPSVTVRMDFRGADVGDFVYHCHFIFHSDFGMMAIIRVLPGPFAANPSRSSRPARSATFARPQFASLSNSTKKGNGPVETEMAHSMSMVSP
jgi:FtsP/CotA-like multicopper oxidase with cupredoxin domain